MAFPTVFVIGTGRSVFEATFAAATPALAGVRVQLVNSVASGLKGLALVLGMSLAAVAVPIIGFRGVFVLDAASYAVSAAALLMLPLRLRDADSAGDGAQRERGVPWRTLLGAGIVALLAVRGLDALGSSSHHVGLPILGDLREPSNAAGVAGVLWMAWAAGMLVGSCSGCPTNGAARHSGCPTR